MVPLLAALETRLRVGIMVGAGLGNGEAMPEADAVRYAPYARQPMLMLNGRYDSMFPVETSQQVLFDLLGTPLPDKKHVVFESGHQPPVDRLSREVLQWLDRYLGAVAVHAG